MCRHVLFIVLELRSSIMETIKTLTESLPRKVKPKKRTWKQRMDNSETVWEQSREAILSRVISNSCITETCRMCNSLCAQISCEDCLERYLCFKCDEARYIYYPFHNRISHAAGYRVPLASNEIIDENGNIVTAGLDIFYVLTTFCWFPI